jgi:hypothetical protein
VEDVSEARAEFVKKMSELNRPRSSLSITYFFGVLSKALSLTPRGLLLRGVPLLFFHIQSPACGVGLGATRFAALGVELVGGGVEDSSSVPGLLHAVNARVARRQSGSLFMEAGGCE